MNREPISLAVKREGEAMAADNRDRAAQVLDAYRAGRITTKSLWKITVDDHCVEFRNMARFAQLGFRAAITNDVHLIAGLLEADAWVQKTVTRQVLCAPVFNPISRRLLRFRAWHINRVLSKPTLPKRQFRPIADYMANERR